jgi:hypothetical protein
LATRGLNGGAPSGRGARTRRKKVDVEQLPRVLSSIPDHPRTDLLQKRAKPVIPNEGRVRNLLARGRWLGTGRIFAMHVLFSRIRHQSSIPNPMVCVHSEFYCGPHAESAESAEGAEGAEDAEDAED